MTERDDERAERHDRILKELAELGMVAARDLTARLVAARTDVEAERLNLALQHASRSVRLTLAMETRLEHERRKGSREANADRKRAIEHRKKQVDHAITGQVYAEREAEEAEALLEKLDDLIDEHMLYEAFLDGPLEAVIARLRQDLGLPPLAGNDPDGEALGLPTVRAGPS